MHLKFVLPLLIAIFVAFAENNGVIATGSSVGSNSSGTAKSPSNSKPKEQQQQQTIDQQKLEEDDPTKVAKFGGPFNFEIKDLKNSLPVPIIVNCLDEDFNEVKKKEVKKETTKFIGCQFPIKMVIPDYEEDFLFKDDGDYKMFLVNCKNLGDVDAGGGIMLPDLMCKEFRYKDFCGQTECGDYNFNLWNDETNGGQLWIRGDHSYFFGSEGFAYQITGITRQRKGN